MHLQRHFCFVLLAALTRAVVLTPITETKHIGRSKANTMEDLFFISETEEKSFDEETLNLAIIEKLKARILHGLKLKEVPKSHPPVPNLQTFRLKNKVWRNSGSIVLKEHKRQHLRSEFLSSEIIPNTCFDRTGPQCVRFQVNIPSTLSIENSLSELWLYKTDGATEFKFTQIIDEPGRSELKKELFIITNQTESAGWIRFDASILLAKLSPELSSNVLDIEVFSSDSTRVPIEIGIDRNPLLVVLSKSSERTKGRRSKRAAVTDCSDDTTTCCRKSQYLSFHDIGWDDWIVQPEGYYANICKGKCTNIVYANTHHAQVMINLISRSSVINNNDIQSSIHCTPKAYKPLSIIYTDDKGLKVISNLPDMSVTECACS
ncbi:hypothetical protein JTE90_012178 [Oedothorax gibbosus]|uniref:TGF-beta family profile domain-containing protein n=1 Tax=Oedothorax gibbosus TaxID=931172 RepID=A0AAV6TSX4_9ARAC|nr:hypothetical protein JTE90_012178 [Oedothorax gibbosus]